MVPERGEITSAVAVAEALDYLGRGLPFHAHEVLEQRWRCSPAGERPWWRALAQAAAGVTQGARGNGVGADRLRERAAAVAGGLDDAPAPVVAAVGRSRVAALLELLGLGSRR